MVLWNQADLWPKPIGLGQRSAATWRCGLHSSPRALVTTVVSRVVLRRVRNCRSYIKFTFYLITCLLGIIRHSHSTEGGTVLSTNLMTSSRNRCRSQGFMARIFLDRSIIVHPTRHPSTELSLLQISTILNFKT